MKTTVHCDFNFRAAHFLRNDYPGKCKNMHGEFYRVRVWVEADTMDRYGMVVDFGDVKNAIYGKYDHKCMNDIEPFKTQFNPTAENMAIVFLIDLQNLCNAKENKPKVLKVRVYESTNDYAEAVC